MGEELIISLSAKDLPYSEGFTQEEWALLQVRLWRFLGKRTERFTTGDSTSVRVEIAQELLASICFTLSLYFKEKGISPKLLLTEEPDEYLKAGIEIIERKIEETKFLWQRACLTAPEIVNYSYQDTLRGIGGFWQHYDYRFLAHQIPCDIDYQLCHHVSDDDRGVVYIDTYLRRIVMENTILGLFDPSIVINLLEHYCPDYKGLLINLCEPVIANAVGLSLLGKPPLALQITPDDQQKLLELLQSMPKSKLPEVLIKAAGDFCRNVGITDPLLLQYVVDTAVDLSPRIASAFQGDSLAGVFIAF